VIGPDDDLYAASHIGNVFHHSSFLGDAAVAGAGEFKTSPDGKIVELSSKSGHYKPTDKQNYFMLKYFEDRGVDLSSVEFTFYDKDGKTARLNAKDHLDHLKSKKSP
jgi:hypothetical protein